MHELTMQPSRPSYEAIHPPCPRSAIQVVYQLDIPQIISPPRSLNLSLSTLYNRQTINTIMGFIKSVARCVRENKLWRRLSNAKPQRLDDDSNDLIKTTSHTPSVERPESIASASTMVQHSSQEPVVPTESPAHMKQLDHSDLNICTLFDEVDSLDPETSRAIRALSMPEYLVLRMDTIKSPFDTPTKKLDDAIDPGDKENCHRRNGDKEGKSRKSRKSQDEKSTGDAQSQDSGKGFKLKRSVTELLRRRSLKNPRKPCPRNTN